MIYIHCLCCRGGGMVNAGLIIPARFEDQAIPQKLNAIRGETPNQTLKATCVYVGSNPTGCSMSGQEQQGKRLSEGALP